MQCNLTVDSLTRTSATRSVADKRTKHLGGSNKTTKQKLLLRFLLFSSLPIHPFLPTYLPTYLILFSYLPTYLSTYPPSFFLPTYLLTYLSHPFSYLPTYLSTYPPSFFLPTYCFILAIKSEPAVTNLLSFCVPQVFFKPSGGLYTDKGYNISVY